jgi:hypothetical protein
MLATSRATTRRFSTAIHGGTMAQLRSKKLALIAASFLVACLLLRGCRCAGFYSPGYSQNEVHTLFQKNQAELTTFAETWLRDHHDVGMRYEDYRGEKITFTRYARNGTGVANMPAVSPNSREVADLLQFAKRLSPRSRQVHLN